MQLWQDWCHRPTQKKVWTLAAPMMVSNLSVPLVTLADTMVAGHLPHANQLAAVTIGGSIFTLLAGLCGFLRMGTVGFSAQAEGRKDGQALRTVLGQSLMLSIFIALFMMSFLWLFLPQVLALMHTAPKLHELTITYLAWRLPSMPAVLASYTLTGWFLGMHNARIAFYLMLITNLSNIGLNLVFVLIFHMGVTGIALASSVGAVIGIVYGLWHIASTLQKRPGKWLYEELASIRNWRALLGINGDIFIRSLALQGVFFSLTFFGSRLGTDVVAANALLLNGLMITSFALDGLANAVEAMSGKAIGAKSLLDLHRTLTVSGGWSLIGSLVFALFFALAGHWFVNIQTSISNVREVAYTYLPYLAWLPLVAVWSFLFDGLFVGATKAREMRNTMLFSSIVFAGMLILVKPWGNHGLWLAFLGFMAIRGATMAYMAKRISKQHGWI